MKKILILGGTNFIGRNLVERLLKMDEYEITLFNRQQTHSGLFNSVKKIKGDRETEDIRQIESTDWNYIIDLSCYYADSLKSVLNSLRTIDKYIFISTCSVYDNEKNKSILRDEEAEILNCTPEQESDRNPETYGNRKAECERILRNSGFPHIILRPALVYGKYDPTDRFYYWLYHLKKSSVLILPENGERRFSTTYVSDLVETIVQSLTQKTSSGVLNVTTNPETTIKQIIDFSSQILKVNNSVFSVSVEFLNEHNISQWTDMPLWINGDHFTYNNQKLKDELGIKTTDFKTSIEETVAHYDKLKWPEPIYGMNEERKNGLLKKLNTAAERT